MNLSMETRGRRRLFRQHRGVGPAEVSSQQYTAQEISGQIPPSHHTPASQELLRPRDLEPVGLQPALEQQLRIRPDVRRIEPENFSDDGKVRWIGSYQQQAAAFAQRLVAKR